MNKVLDKLLDVEEDLRIREELVGLHAINPFIAHCSSSRGVMLSSHFSQSLVLNNGEENIIQTGLEKQFGDNTFSKKVASDSRIIKIIDRYRSIDAEGVDICVEKLVILEDIETGIVDCINIPYYHKLHQYFGFKYKVNIELLESLKPGDFVSKDTIFADSPSVAENKGYKYGVNGNLCLINLPETTEDGVIISKSFAEKLNYTVFETRAVEFGTDSFPLNIYGDENNYKPFPEIGELVNDDSVIMVLRDYNENLSPALTSINDVRNFDPLFDKAVYVKAPGEDKVINGVKVNYGRIVDIKAYIKTKTRKEPYTLTCGAFKRYSEGLKRYYMEIIEVYNHLTTNKYKKDSTKHIETSEEFKRLVIEAMSVANPNNDSIEYKFKNEKIDLYRIEFVIEYTCTPDVGGKISDKNGSKGVIVQVRDDEDMPRSLDGTIVADIVMDPGSVVSRLNVSRVYEQYFCGASRKTQSLLRNAIGMKSIKELTMEDVNKGFEILLGFLKLIDTEQYEGYANLSDINKKKEILWECLHKEVYILYKVSSKKRAYKVVKDIMNSIYAPHIGPVTFKSNNEMKVTKNDILIAPTYNILLNKVAGSAISTSSSKLNHYGLPVSVSNTSRHRLPYKESSLKTISETENRLFVSYAGRKAAAELKDRAVSIKTHEAIYRNILDAEYPTNIEDAVGRDRVDYNGDVAMDLINNIVNCAGITIDYVDNKE